MCNTGAGAGSCAAAKTGPDRVRSNHKSTTIKQEGEGSPTVTRTGEGGCTPQMKYSAGMPRQEPNTATSYAKGGDGQGRQQG